MKHLANILLTLGTMHYLAFAAEKLKGITLGCFITLAIILWCIAVTILTNKE